MNPALIATALNGARRGKTDHPALPLTLEETVVEAQACHAAGSAMLHLHERDEAGRHSLDAGRYGEALAELARQIPGMLVQITTEAVGIFEPEAQYECLKTVRPAFASVAVREMARDAKVAAQLYHFAVEAGVSIQHILYSAEDLALLQAWRSGGVVPSDQQANVLFVLGRYTKGMVSDPRDLLPFLSAVPSDATWMVCAFGRMEAACSMAALALGGHVRVGFENNLHLPGGELAQRNADLVSLAAAAARHIARPQADAEAARRLLDAPPRSSTPA